MALNKFDFLHNLEVYHSTPVGGDTRQVVWAENVMDLVLLAAVRLTSLPGPASSSAIEEKVQQNDERDQRGKRETNS